MQKIIMIDQDGVVTGRDYKTTKDISGLIAEIAKDCLVVPNSDTPVERLRKNFNNALRLDCDIVVGEMGAVVLCGETHLAAGVSEKELAKYVSRLTSLFLDGGFGCEVGDSATWIREGKKFQPNSQMIIADGQRQQTIAFYLKKTDRDGRPFTDETWSGVGLEMVSGIPLPANLLPFNYNPKYGIAIANAVGSSKTMGYRKLRELHPGATFYMIGDHDIDIINDDAVIHCSVGNGSDKLKAKASFVAKSNLTVGLEECLCWIMKR